MRLLLVAVSAHAQMSGTVRHAANLARCLLLHSDIEALHVVAAPWQRQVLREGIAVEDPRLHLHCVHLESHRLALNLWYYFDLPAIACQLQADVVHLSFSAPLRRKTFPCPLIVTVHDLNLLDVPENFGFPSVVFHRLLLRRCLRAASALACVSDATMERLHKWESADVVNKAVRIYNCVELSRARSGPSPLPPAASAPFLLCVAQHRRNKNIDLAVRTLARMLREKTIHPEMRLVIVGMPGPETARLYRRIEEGQMEPHVVMLSGLAEAELQWCYRNCEALLAPSLMEGFGLQVAEALLAGCRIVCSDIAPFRELGGDHCRYFALGANEDKAFADAILAALRSPRQGPVPLPQISGKVIAAEFIALYRRVTSEAYLSSRGAETRKEIEQTIEAG
jgi:glycosyltransferase involved in cell wall biosynthesis